MKSRLSILSNIILCIVVFLVINKAQGQELNFTHFDVQNGLHTNHFNCSFQDSKGFIWFGSNRGVVKYDGNQFYELKKEDGLTDNDVLGLAEDSKGRIWFLTQNGLPCFYENGKIHNVLFGFKLKHRGIISSITSFYEDKMTSDLYFGTNGSGVMKITKEGVEKLDFVCPGDVWPARTSKIYFFYKSGKSLILLTISELYLKVGNV